MKSRFDSGTLALGSVSKTTKLSVSLSRGEITRLVGWAIIFITGEHMTELKPIDKIWTEKYRPKLVKDIVGDFKDKISKYLVNEKTVPNFLFHSKVPGTGKTTLAKAIINELKCDALIINSSDDRKIETVRDKVKEFALTKSSKDGKRRCVFMDEFDGMLKASQDALRNVMETYSSNCFFILTCNNINKVIDPIKSRCVVLPFEHPQKHEIEEYLEKICINEKMVYTKEGLTKLVEINYPSIRNCVISLQDLYTEQLPVNVDTVKPVNEIYEDMWKMLMNKNWSDIKKIILESTVDPRDLNSYFWQKSLEEPVNIKILQLTCRNEKDISLGADSKIVVCTSLIEMVK